MCEEARPLSDLGHVGSIVFGILLALVAIWSLWPARTLEIEQKALHLTIPHRHVT